MKKSFVVNNNLSLGINTKTKTNIKSLIIPRISPYIPAQSQRFGRELHTGLWGANAQLFGSFGSGNFLIHTKLEEVTQ